MRREQLAILAAVVIFALQVGLTAALQVRSLEPASVEEYWRWIKAILAAINWSGGLGLAFYLRARYGNSWLIIGVGGVAITLFYLTWYGGVRFQEWAGYVYGGSMALFDILLIERALSVVGQAQRLQDAQAEQAQAHQQALELAQVEADRMQAARELAEAESERERQRRLLALAEGRTVRLRAGSPAGSEMAPRLAAGSGKYRCACGWSTDGQRDPAGQQRQFAGHRGKCPLAIAERAKAAGA